MALAQSSSGIASNDFWFAVFVDADLPDIQHLLTGVAKNGIAVMVARDQEPVDCMSKSLAALHCPAESLLEIGILAHGWPGYIGLGTGLGTQHLADVADGLQVLGGKLRAEGRFRIMACNVAQGQKGRDFVAKLSLMTQRTVLASSNSLGNGLNALDVCMEPDGSLVDF